MIKKPRYDVKRLFYYGLLCTIATLIVFIIIVLAGSARAGTIGVLGRTYPIVEPDARMEIERKAAAIDWDKYFDKKKWEARIKAYKPQNLQRLPAATMDKVRLVDMAFTLPFDVPDAAGNIAYPAGYRFNPLSYAYLPNILVVIDGGKRNQVDWLKRLSFLKDPQVMVIISDGNFYDLIHELRMPVYYLDTQFASRFQLEAVPSIIVQKGVFMEVSEYAVK